MSESSNIPNVFYRGSRDTDLSWIKAGSRYRFVNQLPGTPAGLEATGVELREFAQQFPFVASLLRLAVVEVVEAVTVEEYTS